MNPENLKEMLLALADGRLTVEEGMQRLRHLPYEDVGFAKVDHHRGVRTGFPEAIYCAGKTPEQVLQIALRIREHGDLVLATRAAPEVHEHVSCTIPEAVYHEAARIIRIGDFPAELPDRPPLAVVSAGTADIPVADEAALVAAACGIRPDRIIDVGVAGIHRLLDHHERLAAAGAVVVVAGMEGALASVVAGLIDKPVIGVPTSVGYGASLGGIAPLLTMLNSCALGMATVNIDNGFGAGYLGAMICKNTMLR